MWVRSLFVGLSVCVFAPGVPAGQTAETGEQALFQCEAKLANARATLTDLQKDYEFLESTYDAVLGSAIKARKDFITLKDEHSRLRYCVASVANVDEAAACLKK